MSDSSLIPFHRVLITAGIVFCGGFAAWTFVDASRSSDGVGAAAWVVTIVFAILALGLAVYLVNLSRFLGYRDD